MTMVRGGTEFTTQLAICWTLEPIHACMLIMRFTATWNLLKHEVRNGKCEMSSPVNYTSQLAQPDTTKMTWFPTIVIRSLTDVFSGVPDVLELA